MDQPSLFCVGEHAMDPKDRVERCCCWIRDNWGTFIALVGICERHERRAGSANLRRGDVYVIAQMQGFSVTDSKQFRFDNNLWSVLSRYLILWRPGLARIIHPKPCNIDTVDLVAVWRGIVNPRSFFAHATWQEAERACEAGDVSTL